MGLGRAMPPECGLDWDRCCGGANPCWITRTKLQEFQEFCQPDVKCSHYYLKIRLCELRSK